MRQLTLTNEQFEVLFDIIADTVDALEGDLTSYYDKDGNEIARAIPHNGGLKFPLNKGDQWSQTWTFTAAGGLVTGKSEAEYKVKRETVKANNKKYKTRCLKIANKFVWEVTERKLLKLVEKLTVTNL